MSIGNFQLMESKCENDESTIEGKACSISKNDQSTMTEEPLHTDRENKIKHMPDNDDKPSGSRCKLPKCQYFTHVYCQDCGKYLCFTRKRNCYALYHSQMNK